SNFRSVYEHLQRILGIDSTAAKALETIWENIDAPSPFTSIEMAEIVSHLRDLFQCFHLKSNLGTNLHQVVRCLAAEGPSITRKLLYILNRLQGLDAPYMGEFISK
ncbi:unnamed protein product, partial [Owenia fusiformis]